MRLHLKGHRRRYGVAEAYRALESAARLEVMRLERAEGATLEAIGRRHGLSRQRVHQLLSDSTGKGASNE